VESTVDAAPPGDACAAGDATATPATSVAAIVLMVRTTLFLAMRPSFLLVFRVQVQDTGPQRRYDALLSPRFRRDFRDATPHCGGGSVVE
jgi:hypothetical protein